MKKTYYLYVDESGSFKSEPGRHTSFVGAFVASTSPEILIREMQSTLEEFQNHHGKILGFEDIHAALLLHPENFPASKSEDLEKQRRYPEIPEKTRHDFIGKFRKILLEKSVFFVKSENDQFKFSHDPQALYGTCLMACLRKVFDLLSRQADGSFEVLFLIAYRSQICIPKGTDFHDYHNRLVAHVSKKFNFGSSSFSKLELKRIRSTGKPYKLLLDLADVACHTMKEHDQGKINGKVELYLTRHDDPISDSFK